MQVHVQLDERSGGFFALGAAKATGRPAIVACTSGTAAAELLPAVVEASQARVPLIVLTADRPPRLRGTGANQTIVQPELYGGYVHASYDLPVPTTAGQEAWWHQAAHEAIQAMATDPVGPVHLNCPFEEPLTPSVGVAPARPDAEPLEGRERPTADLDPDETDRLTELVSGKRGVIVVGGLPEHLRGESHFWSGSDGMARPRGTDLRRSRPGDRPRRRPDPDRGSLVGGTSPRGRHPVRRLPDQSVDAASRGVGRPARGRGSMAPRSRIPTVWHRGGWPSIRAPCPRRSDDIR